MALSVLLLTQAVHADVSVKVFPTYLEFTSDAGASTSQLLTISNEGTDDANVSIAAGVIRSARPEDSAVTWLSTEVQHVILKPGESQSVTVTIRIPKDAKPGGHFAALYVHASAAVSSADLGARGAGTGVGTSILSSFLITVRSPQPTDLKLEATVVKVVPVAVGADKLDFRVEVQNNGNVHFVPKGDLELVDLDEVVREVWSNTAGSDYVLMVRLGDRWGADYPATEGVLAQLRRIEPALGRGVTHVR